MNRRARLIAVAIAIAAALYAVLHRLGNAGSKSGLPAWDVYALFYPNALYALRAVHDGGRGLLWNALQNCGQPFLGNVEVGLLYPPNVLFLVLGVDAALRAVLFVDLVVGGVSAFLLCRTLGLATVASIGGAIGFELGNAMMFNTVWAPQPAGSFAWLPAAMLCTERIVRGPTVRRGVALGVVLALALAPGFPQTVLFIYQLVALRVAWELLTPRTERRTAIAFVALLGMALPLLLNAAQLLPAIEVFGESVRSRRLSIDESFMLGRLELADFGRAEIFRSAQHNPLLLVSAMLAAVAFAKRETRRLALFFAGAGVLYFVLALGRSTVLYEWYFALPFGGLFREPVRFMWIASFCGSMLAAFGLDALVDARRAGRVAGWGMAVVVGLVAALCSVAAPAGLTRAEWVLGGATVAVFVLAAAWPAQAGRLAVAALAVLSANVVVAPAFTYMNLMRDGDALRRHAAVFEDVRARMTPQDRIYVAPRHPKFDLMQKTASVFGLPSIQDYGSQTSARYATMHLRMRLPRTLQSRLDLDVRFFGDSLYANTNRHLLNLVGTRFLIVGAEADGVIAGFRPAMRLVRDGDVRVYENPDALPRAFYVPRVEVVPDGDAALWSLASGARDVRQVAVVEAPLPFQGVAGNTGTGRVEFVQNDPEHVRLDVDAPERGFLFMSDQWFPGWSATVDGAPADVVRANYVFRLIEVPRGRSTVELRYAPASVRIGVVVSVLAIVAVAWILLRR
jgi:hypothetical protein